MRIMNKTATAVLLAALLISAAASFTSCNKGKEADSIYYNGTVYTLDSAFTIHTAFAVKDGRIVATGSDKEILAYTAASRTDLKGKIVYPGFHDAHCHFYGYGNDLKKIWLLGTPSFEAILDTLKKHKSKQVGGWIFGRGWDQNDWDVKEYPDKTELDSLFPSIPVFLLRIDGHAAVANQLALDMAGITSDTRVNGGLVEMKNGRLTGLLIDSAVDLMYAVIPKPTREENIESLMNAQKDCFAAGLTSVTDAGIENTGLKAELIALIDSMQMTNQLQMRLNIMAALEEFSLYEKKGKYKTNSLSVQSFKMYADGSLGSRGACLLQPYEDQPGHYGFLIHSAAAMDSIAAKVAAIGFQLNTHCIGDSSHRLVLQIYEKHIRENKDHRWRIEHAQVINPADLVYYQRNQIIPSMQPVHATSDMYWAEQRLGKERIKGAYALKDLLDHRGIIAAGSDFPVEHINPLFGFYAAVSRKDQKGFPEKGFMKENALTRQEALKAMTIWAAYAAFNEKQTGSLETGKFADFVLFEEDLMKVPEEKIFQLHPFATYMNGKLQYQRGE
jgi:predicted amidohydrolase YtcJ